MSASPRTPRAGARLRRVPLPVAPLLIFSLVACGAPSSGSQSSKNDAAVSLEQAAALVATSWARSAATEPEVVSALLDAPGGEGWLHLFHGDLDRAEGVFRPLVGSSPACRVGLGRVLLARADELRSVDSLHRAAALDLARYRRDRRDRVRTGPNEPALAALVALAGASEGEERAAFLSAVEGKEGPLAALVRARVENRAAPADLPAPLAARLAFVAAVDRADSAAARTLEPALDWGAPGFEDQLGGDEDVGLRFTAPYFDAEPLRAQVRLYAIRAAELAEGTGAIGEPIRVAAEQLWGAALPAPAARSSAVAASELPAWVGLLFAPVPDAASWAAYWSDRNSDGPTTLAFLAAAGLTGGSADAAGADKLLRASAAAESVLDDALRAGASEEGVSLVSELRLARGWVDSLLRGRMRSLVAAGAPIPAKRAGERSLDPNPGSLGGPADARRTRVSYRNDRAFLIDLATVLHRAGQTGAALDFVHPLAAEDPRLRGLEHYLGQLDAASSIGVLGKANRM